MIRGVPQNRINTLNASGMQALLQHMNLGAMSRSTGGGLSGSVRLAIWWKWD